MLSQRAESGEVDWGKAAVDTVVEVVIGALGGAGVVAAGTRAAHAAASASRLGRAALVIGGVNSAAGGIGGASSHVVNRDTQQPWSWRDFAGKTAGGAVSSGLGETGGARGRDPGAGERLCRALARRPGLEPGIGAGSSVLGGVVEQGITGDQMTVGDVACNSLTGGVGASLPGRPHQSDSPSSSPGSTARRLILSSVKEQMP